ncbi:MAG: macro domain-containing protein [Bellilinea sp.]
MSQIKRAHTFSNGQCLELVHGDLTLQEVDAIVNAANEYLQHGGGVAGAIVRKGGWVIQEESDRWVQQHGPVTHAAPAYTTAGKLPCKYVIHAVGPVWGVKNADERLATAVFSSLRLAESLGIHSIALPAISTGIFGFPKDRAARIMFHAITEYFNQNPRSQLGLIRLTLLDQETLEEFTRIWDEEMNQPSKQR